jgi:hypothetical protein
MVWTLTGGDSSLPPSPLSAAYSVKQVGGGKKGDKGKSARPTWGNPARSSSAVLIYSRCDKRLYSLDGNKDLPDV